MELAAANFAGPAPCVYTTQAHDFAIVAGAHTGPVGAEYEFSGGQTVVVLPHAPSVIQSAPVHLGMQGPPGSALDGFDYDAIVGAALSI